MDFARINPELDGDAAATWHVELEGELLYDKGQPIEIDVLGLDGKVGKRAAAAMAKSLDATRGRKRQKELKNMSVDEILAGADRNDSLRAKFYAALTTGWRNITYIDDEKRHDPKAEPEALEFSQENAVMLYSTRPWIMAGLDDFLADRSNFRQTA